MDALRALGALLVFLFHAEVVTGRHFGPGWTGVILFFALSGYLIGGRLLELSDRKMPLGVALSSFYWRRAVRIFPVYLVFLTCVTAYALSRDAQTMIDWLPYAWTYTSNFFHASSVHRHDPFLAPTWSLAVEEQFYLLFPFVVLLLGRRRLLLALILLIAAGPLIRFTTAWAIGLSPQHFTGKPLAIYVLGFTHVDAFAFGALVNLLPRDWCHRLGRMRCIVPTMVLIMAIGGLATGSLRGARFSGFPTEIAGQFVWAYTLVNIVSMMLICRAVSRADAILGTTAAGMAATAALARLGQWSYSFYLIHWSALGLVGIGLPSLGLPLPGWLGLPLALAADMALARLLYEAIERPAQRLRSLFDRPSRVTGA